MTFVIMFAVLVSALFLYFEMQYSHYMHNASWKGGGQKKDYINSGNTTLSPTVL